MEQAKLEDRTDRDTTLKVMQGLFISKILGSLVYGIAWKWHFGFLYSSNSTMEPVRTGVWKDKVVHYFVSIKADSKMFEMGMNEDFDFIIGGISKMHVDLNFWKYKEGVIHDDSKIYEMACCTGATVNRLESLPIDGFWKKLLSLFQTLNIDILCLFVYWW